MMMSKPVLRRIEEQILASLPDRSVALSASAGSGKTRALVMRLMHLMLAGVPPENVAAVTFTEKAAAEMKDRLFGYLEEAAMQGLDPYETIGVRRPDTPFELNTTPEGLYSRLMADPDSLKVQTIHALCLWLIRRFTLESGLLPGFELADEAQSAMMKDIAVEDLFSETARTGDLYDVDALYGCGVTVSGIKRAVVRALGMRSQLAAVELTCGGADSFLSRLMQAASDADRRYGEFFGSAGLSAMAKKMKSLINGSGLAETLLDGGYLPFLEQVGGITGPHEFEEAYEHCRDAFLTQTRNPRSNPVLTKKHLKEALRSADPALKGRALDALVDEIREEHGRLQEAFVEACSLHDSAVSARGLLSLWRIFKAAGTSYASVKNARGLADFDDLETGAYRLLGGPHGFEALLEIEPRLLHYLVDEFQDTSDLQWEIIRILAGEALAGEGAEGLRGSTLFAVGDAKQSIYRFRNANYGLIERLRVLMAERVPDHKREVLELTHNFRSAPEVLDVVNETFSRLMGDGYSPSSNEDERRFGSVRLVVTEPGSEMSELGDRVERYLGVKVWDDNALDYRPAGFGDMAVLIRSRAILGSLENEFAKRGIPYKVMGGVGFFSRDEIMAMTALLKFVDDRDDRLSLEIFLRSDLFGMSALSVHEILASDDCEAALERLRPDAHSLVDFLRRRAGLITCGELVGMAVDESGARAAFSPGHPSASANLDKLRKLAHDYDRRVAGGPGDFLRWLDDYERLSDAGAADPDSTSEGPGRGEISIMTVHGAKGLEFPVVFLPGASRKAGWSAGGLLVGGSEFDRIELKTSSFLSEPPGYASLKEEEYYENEKESVRLMYVAMTRARDHLVISGEGGKKVASSSWMRMFQEAAPPSLFGGTEGDRGDSFEVSYPSGNPPLHTDGAPLQAGPPGPTGMPDPAMLEPIEPVSLYEYVKPSTLAAGPDLSPEPEAPWPPALRGSIIHAVLESYGRTGSYDTRVAAARYPGYLNLPGDVGESLVLNIDTAISRLLEDGTIRLLIDSGEKKYHEPELLAVDGSRIVYGNADLVSITGDSARVIDFKTGHMNADLRDIRTAYAPQLGLYGKAVRSAFGVSTVELVLILVDRGEAIYI